MNAMRGLSREGQGKLNAGGPLRGMQRSFVGPFFGCKKFSMLLPFLRYGAQDAVCQTPQLFPIGIALVLHFTLHCY